MFQNRFEKRKGAIVAQIHINDYLRRYAWELYKGQRRPVIRSRSDADYYKKLFSDPMHSPLRSMLNVHSGDLYKYCQDIDYVPSNLGKGFIFYFICVWCGRRAKYLYADEKLDAMLCRKCIKFPYRQPTRPERKASRYIKRHPELVWRLIESGEVPVY